MSRIVLTTTGSLGDLHPFIAIGLGLRDRGHDIVFATIKDYRTRIESLGFEFHSIRPDHIAVDDPQMLALMMDLQKGTERVIRDYLLASFRDTYTDLLAACQNADFIVSHELVYAAPLVAEILNLRWAFCALAPGAFLSAYDPFVLPPFPALVKLRGLGAGVNRLVVNFVKFITRDWGEPVRQLRQELGLAAVGNPIVDDKFSPYLVLALFSSVIGSPQPDWAANTVVTGFPFYDGDRDRGLAPDLNQFLDSGEPPLVFTLGSAAVLSAGDFYTESVKAAKILDRRAVLLVGKNPPPANLPTNMVAFDYAPYSKIFPRACALVHQGGIGTTAQGLRSGRPTLIMPYSHDQPDNAARVQRLGTSLTIPRKQYTAARVAKKLDRLLHNSSYATKAIEISGIIQAEKGVKMACDEIERQLNGRNN
ncbi:glycosyltransferase [Chamaesiphon polymorphus]|uniref:Glycosyl transferase n=1 Tax=Chamaesiphon polymorphus CCALA 037 TaxID=2107692 RepID=A0A2T1GNA9_9CYAN|nr:glycosyltransferase [Chamaesiphon polymorphus]PSB59426.1 glycosyl transferase [Chamaesiphon polymorphus CCALA 037]